MNSASAAAARNAIKAAPGVNAARGSFDWLHINSATYVGPNHWFDEGDQRFAPNNVIISSRQASFLAIVARDGKIVWRLGPDFSESKELLAIRQIIGQHHAHIIPKGLPGAGNVWSSTMAAPAAMASRIRPRQTAPIRLRAQTSRVLEINPVTLELVWSYAGPRFYSSNISGAQRLPNGNTLVTEGASGRLFEVTKESKIVWEYITPSSAARNLKLVYRGYRSRTTGFHKSSGPKNGPSCRRRSANFRVP